MKNYFLLSLCALLFLATSCKKSIEGETKKFDSNIQRLNEVAAKYPSFKAACETLKTDATKQMEAAKSLSEEKAKIEAMAAANNIASPTWVNDLSNIDNKINSIRDMSTKASQNSHDHNDSDAAWVASRQGEDAIREANNKLGGTVDSPSAAAAIVSSIISNLDAAERRLSDVVKTAENKKDAEKKAQNEEKAAKDSTKATEEKKAAPVKCGFCGNSNPAGTAKCSGCGAQLK
jgi:chromosome segregation ATPase